MFFITVVNVPVATGYAIAGMVSPQRILPEGAVTTRASAVFAFYAAARTLPLAVMVIYSVLTRKKTAVFTPGRPAVFNFWTVLSAYTKRCDEKRGTFLFGGYTIRKPCPGLENSRGIVRINNKSLF